MCTTGRDGPREAPGMLGVKKGTKWLSFLYSCGGGIPLSFCIPMWNGGGTADSQGLNSDTYSWG